MKMAFFVKSTANLFNPYLRLLLQEFKVSSLLRPHPQKRSTVGAIHGNQKAIKLV